MGLETIVFASLTALSAASKMSAARDQAKQITRNGQAQADALKVEGELAAKEKAKQIRHAAARQTSSFLSSGITLEGTPMDVLDETYTTGREDIENIGRNYQTSANNVVSNANAQAKNTISSARTEVIGDIAGSFGNSTFGQSLFDSNGFTVPFTGSSSYVNAAGIPIPGNKPTRINW